MDLKDFTEKLPQYHRISSLVSIMISVMLAMIGVIIPFILDFSPKNYETLVKILSLFIVETSIVIHWYCFRAIFPKGNKKKQSIIIAIITENEKQKIRLSQDFANHFESQLIKYQLNKKYDIKVLHNALSIQLKLVIENAFINDIEKNPYSIEKEKYRKTCKRMNAKFIVFGNLVSRNSPNNRYLLNIEALINHRDIPQIQRIEMQEAFREIWNREISFLEEEEIKGFKSTSEQIFFAATYMLGLATLVDWNFSVGIEINHNLLRYVKENDRYKEFESKVTKLLSSSYLMFSRVLYFNGEFEKSILIRRKFHELTSDTYDSYLSESIYHMNKRKDPETALEFVEKAQRIANNGTWKYNKLYLLIILDRHVEALKVLDMILSTKFDLEFDVINQVISYNQHCLKNDPCHIQSLFITGVLTYKKLNNPSAAYEKLEEFINLSKNIIRWKYLNERAREYFDGINKEIGIEQK